MNHNETLLYKTLNRNSKAIISVFMYALATVFSFVLPIIAVVICIVVAAFWFIPNKKLEKENYLDFSRK